MNVILTDIMVAMMPYMKPMFMLGLVVAGAGLLLLIAKPVLGSSAVSNLGLLWAGRISGLLGIFFLACQPMGMWLSASPNLKFGNMPPIDYWLELAFWQIGLGLLIAAIVIGLGVKRAQ
jgi:hypothetical protein